MSLTKHIQVIDPALNCTYDIFAASEEDFALLFPDDGQDIEFAEDFFDRAGDAAQAVWDRLWAHRVDKKTVHGIHGTLFSGFERKKRFYPTKRESEMVTGYPAERTEPNGE